MNCKIKKELHYTKQLVNYTLILDTRGDASGDIAGDASGDAIGV